MLLNVLVPYALLAAQYKRAIALQAAQYKCASIKK